MNFDFLLIILLLFCNDVISSVVVEVNEGRLRGQILMTSTTKVKYYSFKGIPYAKPPVGELRFRPPQPPVKWGERNATEHGSVCVQYKEVPGTAIIGEEDCLFLNVYTLNINPFRPLPVMFYIHGGFFVMGSGNDDFYGPDYLMDHNIVLVTINYRLGVLGFLSANIEEAAGNAGLKDQIAALKWVQKNIRNFGGDPSRVTIFGDSVGGSSVTLHMIVPAARGLFQRAISMSGVLNNDFARDYEPERRAFALGRTLGLETDDPKKLLDHLLKQPAKELFSKQPEIILLDKPQTSLLSYMYFLPVVEKQLGNGSDQYLTKSPLSLMQSSRVNKADLLIGHTALEGLGDAYAATEAFLQYYPIYKELLVPLKISYFRSLQTILKLGDRIKNFYFGNKPINLKTIKELVTYSSYSHFVYDIHAYIENLHKCPSTKRYFYEFEIYSERNVYSKPAAEKFGIKKATHMDDLPYLFYGSGYNITEDTNKKTFKYVKLMCTLFTNFAKYGTPTPDNSLGLIWPEYEPNKTAVTIGEEGELTTHTISYSSNTSIGFWYRLYQSVGIVL